VSGVEREVTTAGSTAAEGAGSWQERAVWRQRATWQVNLRWVVGPVIAVAVAAGHALGFEFAAIPVLAVAVAILGYNAVLAVAFKRMDPADPQARYKERRCEVAQVALDYAAMLVLAYFTGGAGSPLIWFFTFHVIFAAILFRSSITWLFALVATGGVWLMAAAQAAGLIAVHAVRFEGQIIFPPDSPAAIVVDLLSFTVTTFVIAAVTTAITARLRAANARAYAAMETLMQERSQYMLQVAHNVRAPLAASISMLDVLAQGLLGELNERQQGYMDRVIGRLTSMNDTLGDLLKLALSRQRAEQKVRRALDLGDLVAAVVRDFEDEASSAAVTLRMHSPHGPVMISGDAESLVQMTENLVSNAVKYTPRGGSVDVRVSASDGEASLDVRDTGIGIPAAEQGRLFEEFFRASNAQESGIAGTGLGMTIVRETVEAHGGRVDVESAEGLGTTVTVVLPRW